MTEQTAGGFSDLCDLLWMRRAAQDFSTEGVAMLLTLEDERGNEMDGEAGQTGANLSSPPLPGGALLAAVADALYLQLRPRFVLEADAAACALNLLAKALPGEPGEPERLPVQLTR